MSGARHNLIAGARPQARARRGWHIVIGAALITLSAWFVTVSALQNTAQDGAGR